MNEAGAGELHLQPGRLGPTPLGRRAFIAGVVGAIAGASLASGVSAAVPAGATYFVPIAPRRICETRPRSNPFGFTRLDANTIRVQVAGNGDIPATATAAVLTVAGIRTSPVSNWVQVVPAGTWSDVSNLNMSPTDDAVANLVTVKLGVGGSIDVRSESPCDIIVDIAGAYVPTSSIRRGGRLVTIDPVVRPYDTRNYSNNRQPVWSGGTVTVDLTGVVPSDAVAVVATLTAVSTQLPGFLTAFPADVGAVPNASNLNFGLGEDRAAAVMTKLGDVDGRTGTRGIKVFVFGGCHLLVDVAGYITGDSTDLGDSAEGLFVPVQPTRMLDTRRPTDKAAAGGRARLWPGWTRSFDPRRPVNGGASIPAQAGAVAMNTTAAAGMSHGFLTVLPAQTVRREVSNVNIAAAGQNVANHVITRVSTAGVEVFSSSGCHLICDVTGWFVGSPLRTTRSAPIDPPVPAAPPSWRLRVPRMNLDHSVESDFVNANRVVDRGLSWHWTNTGYMGQTASVVVFGHRTSRSAPYYWQHILGAGDVLYVNTSDGRIFTYRYAGERITSAAASEILSASRQTPGSTFTLVSCTGSSLRRDDQPRGGIRYRLVTTFALESWADLG